MQNDATADIRRETAIHEERRARILTYMQGCRARVPGFIDSHYSLRGTLRLHRRAWGRDLLVAPFNFLLMFPAFLLWLIATLLELCRARRAAGVLFRINVFLPTRVEQQLSYELERELLQLSTEMATTSESETSTARAVSRDALRTYLKTRHAGNEVTAALVAIVAGLVLFSQFTPGSVSTGTALANYVASERAARDFFLGDYLGRVYYGVFPAEPSTWMLVASLAAAMLALSVVSAFAGVLHDPLQRRMGIHRRRLNRMLDAIERGMLSEEPARYRPRDTLASRLFDLLDWLKGLFTI